MTVQDVVLDLLQYIGVTSFTRPSGINALNRPGLDARDTSKALVALNSALQEIQKYGPLSLRQADRSVFINDPTPLTLGLTPGSTAATLTSPPSWIYGCSLLINGDGDLNRIVDVDQDNLTLLRPYRGSATSEQATIYGDAAQLDSDVKAVVEPVTASPNLILHRADSTAEFMRWTRSQYQARGFGTWIGVGPAKVIGRPQLFLVDRERTGRLLLRLTPMPAQSATVSFTASLKPERFDESALSQTGAEDPGVEFETISEDDVETILLPIARWKFFAHPALKNAETRQTIKLEYDNAMLTLKNGLVLEPSVASQRATYI